MRRSSRDVQDSAENLLRYSQEPDDLREAARPAMPSSFECAQAVQMFEQGRRLHFGIKEHQNRRWPRLTKNFYNLFSIDLRHANIHQNDVRSFLLHLFKVFQGSHRPYFGEASEDSLGRRVRTLLFQGNSPYRHTTSSRTDILTVRVEGCDSSVKTVSGHTNSARIRTEFSAGRAVPPSSPVLWLAKISYAPKMARFSFATTRRDSPKSDRECSRSASILCDGNPLLRACAVYTLRLAEKASLDQAARS